MFLLVKMMTTKLNVYSAGIYMFVVVILCLSISVTEPTKVLKEGTIHKYESQVARFRRERAFDHSCDGFDCSQQKRAEFVKDEIFICKVGMQTECDAVNKKVKADQKEEKNPNYAKLSNIQIFDKTYKKLYPEPYRSLNYSIALPNHDKEGLKATMIMTIFSSKNDDYYNKKHICRVFDFSKSNFTHNDLQAPRVINYPCIFGLNDMAESIDYTLNITVLPYQASVLYYIQIYSHDYRYELEWSVNNGVSVLNLLERLHVVFQAHPFADLEYYQLILYKNSQNIQTKQIARSKNQYEFNLEEGGQYSVGIKPVVKHGECRETRTRSVIWKVEVKPVEDKKQKYVNMASFVLPIVVVIILVTIGAVGFCLRYHNIVTERHVDESTEQFLENQHPSDESTIPFNMIEKWNR